MKILITKKKIERITIRHKKKNREFHCEICDRTSIFLTPEETAPAFGINFFDLLDQEVKYVHFFENNEGTVLICGNSLLNSEREK